MKQPRSTVSLVWYLCYLSKKYNIDVPSIYHAFANATNTQKSIIGPLIIQCRNNTEDSTIFLIQEGTKFLSQQRISHKLFEEDALLKIHNRLGLSQKKINKARKYHSYYR
jgi:hypothetical protein